jgi:hypothetical protein
MNDNEAIRDALAAVAGVTVVGNEQTKGNGHHYFTFRANLQTLERLCKALVEIPNFGVVYDNGVGRLDFPPGHEEKLIEQLGKA